MTESDLEALFEPILKEVTERASVAGAFVDKDLYRVYFGTIWANVVLDPEDSGIEEADLESLHGVLNRFCEPVLGCEDGITECYRFLNTKAGEQAMDRAKVTKTHRDLLMYFASMILDPEGHKKWMDDIADKKPGR